jgi:hypothetical protein
MDFVVFNFRGDDGGDLIAPQKSEESNLAPANRLRQPAKEAAPAAQTKKRGTNTNHRQSPSHRHLRHRTTRPPPSHRHRLLNQPHLIVSSNSVVLESMTTHNEASRLPTLSEVVSSKSASPVDLFGFYVYMRDEQRSVDCPLPTPIPSLPLQR